MSDDVQQASEVDADTDDESRSAVQTDADGPVVVDLDSAEAYEQQIEQLQEAMEEQQDRIEELEDLLVDLSVRAADDRGLGVCPECHGPVEKVRRWFGPTTIECTRCRAEFHEY